MGEQDRVGITPRSWNAETGAAAHHGVLHLGKRWYVVSAQIDVNGHADGVRLDGPYPERESAEAQARRMQDAVIE